MNLERLFQQIVSPERKFYHAPAFFLFYLFSLFYGALVRARIRLYASGLLSVKKLSCRVISVGNLTLGGTGKTPMVMHIAGILRDHGHKPVILSRGYKGRSKQAVNVVSDGKAARLTAADCGDEAAMMAARLRDIPVLTGPDRHQTGAYAIEHLGAGTLILDDGFQHLRLHRDLNIALFDHNNPIGNGHIFPAGHLREPMEGIQRADLICLTRCQDGPAHQALDSMLPSGVPVVKTALRIESLQRLGSGETTAIEVLRAQKIAAFSGIGNPGSFRGLLARARFDVVYFKAFPDHHPYSPADLAAITEAAQQAGATALLTTEKDAIKLSGSASALPAYKTIIALTVLDGEDLFNQALLAGAHPGKKRP